MKAIPMEAGRVTYSTEIRNLKKINFSGYERAVIIGSILGDGCLCENWSKTNYRLIISHSVDQKEYIDWKYKILKQWILTAPRFYERNRSLTIRTISHPELTTLRNVFYLNGKKIIPKNSFELIKNPVVLAVWFMDDGNVNNDGYNLNTQSFSQEENSFLVEILKKEYGIICSIEKNKGYSRLYIWKRSAEAFRQIINDFVVPSLRYKLG